MIVITGATGNTGRAAAETLLAKGAKVRAVGRDLSKLQPLAALGAEPYVTNIEDAESMTAAFEGASAVYLLVPPAMELEDFRAYQDRVNNAYATALIYSGVPHAVVLSSVGAERPQGTGPILGLHSLELKLNALPSLHVLYLRPASFMENLLRSIQPLRSMGTLPGPASPDAPRPLIAARDIGVYAAARLAARDFSGSSVHELLGPRDYTMREVAAIIGQAIGKPHLGYMQVPLVMLEGALVQMGFPKSSAVLMIDLFKAENSGLLHPHERRSPRNTTPTTLESFAADVFAPAYLGKSASA